MISLSNIKSLTSTSLGRTGLILSKKSPEILLGVGVVGIIAGTILACKATLKVEKVIKETKNTLENIEEAKKAIKISEEVLDKELYSEKDYQRDLAITYVKTGVELAKLYMPAIAVTGISIALIVGSHNILSKRNAAIAAAYKLIDVSFKQYRERVRNEYGEEADQKMRFGEKEITVIETNAKGKVKEVTKKVLGNKDIAPYSFVWSEQTATQYKRSYDTNHSLLRSFERFANDILNTRGHIFLNEILDDLGLERTSAGAIVGWVKDYNPHNPNNDQYITFGLNDPVNEERQDPYEAMVQPWFLNFNVDGNIYDLI
jgi:hypothetical protein